MMYLWIKGAITGNIFYLKRMAGFWSADRPKNRQIISQNIYQYVIYGLDIIKFLLCRPTLDMKPFSQVYRVYYRYETSAIFTSFINSATRRITRQAPIKSFRCRFKFWYSKVLLLKFHSFENFLIIILCWFLALFNFWQMTPMVRSSLAKLTDGKLSEHFLISTQL